MTLRIKLLAAAAFALPATMASAQQIAPTAPPPPMGGALHAGTQANVPPQPVVPPAETPALGTVQQRAQPTAPPAPPAPAQPTETADDVAEQAADAVEADTVAQTRIQAAAQGAASAAPTATTPPPATAAPPAAPAAPAAPVQAQAQPLAPPAVPAGPVSHATAADLRAGIQVRDASGGLVGTVESADAGGAVVNTGTVRARVALSSLGRNNQGLVIALTKAQFEAAASAANPG
ncbi:MAG TPA: hypothetical protein VMS43_00820 [Allosphingosinicella sp.]|nr:hypothetical protein [Allosphingosinicella sp.]